MTHSSERDEALNRLTAAIFKATNKSRWAAELPATKFPRYFAVERAEKARSMKFFVAEACVASIDAFDPNSMTIKCSLKNAKAIDQLTHMIEMTEATYKEHAAIVEAERLEKEQEHLAKAEEILLSLAE